jgi:lipid-A-disaccharide synthase
MLIAGEASGDLLAAELVEALRDELATVQGAPSPDGQPLYASLEPQFFGAGGPRMAAAGVELAFDMTAHSVIGLWEAVKSYRKFRGLFHRLYQLALERQPDAIICVDFSGFNRRFAHAVKSYARAQGDWFHDWMPKVIQYVSPQVWASREGRAYKMARDVDLLLTTFAFEKEWYAKRVPQLRVEFVGNPIVDRHAKRLASLQPGATPRKGVSAQSPANVLLLPGSRPGELRRHLPVLLAVAQKIRSSRPAAFRMVLPQSSLADDVKLFGGLGEGIEVQVGGLQNVLAQADLAITKSGTITLECACFGIPAVVFYKTSALTYLVGKQVVKVKYIAMPNLLAGEEIFPEFVQNAATAENLARAALELLTDGPRQEEVKSRLAKVVADLGGPGASRRAAKAIAGLLQLCPPLVHEVAPQAQRGGSDSGN